MPLHKEPTFEKRYRATSVIMLTLHFHYQVQNGQEEGQECKDGKIVITAR